MTTIPYSMQSLVNSGIDTYEKQFIWAFLCYGNIAENNEIRKSEYSNLVNFEIIYNNTVGRDWMPVLSCAAIIPIDNDFATNLGGTYDISVKSISDTILPPIGFQCVSSGISDTVYPNRMELEELLVWLSLKLREEYLNLRERDRFSMQLSVRIVNVDYPQVLIQARIPYDDTLFSTGDYPLVCCCRSPRRQPALLGSSKSTSLLLPNGKSLLVDP